MVIGSPLSLRLILASISALLWTLCCPDSVAAQPNILLILADDMGYSDAGCFGGGMKTPSIDRLAREGVRLTQFRNGGMCVVSRSSLLTSRWWPKMRTNFTKTPLLSETLKAAGYRTGLIGKWHLRGHPIDRGFDHFFGLMNGAADHFHGNGEFQYDKTPFKEFGSDWYSADAFSDRAISFVTQRPTAEPEKPFFLYLSYQTPHSPLQAPKEDIMKNRGKYLSGWQAIREARFEKQKQLGLFPADATLPDYPENLPHWDSLTRAQRDLEDLRMATYAAMVERMDKGIGRVISALEEHGKLDNTLIVFLSDNGTDPFHSASEAMLARDKLPGDPGSNWQPGFGWAYASVTPWRLYKISQHAGGVTTGAVIRYPGHTGEQGRIEHSSVHLVDLMPTFLEVAGQSTDGRKLEGESFMPLLKGEPWRLVNRYPVRE
ncbi:sulfatase-like hydrolase/transferase [Verrucomicrobiales bacterium]|nr:sulfatase-like hydrolase/transferase [Verrucomicrobiales bacterium]